MKATANSLRSAHWTPCGAAVAHLPDWHPDVECVPKPKGGERRLLEVQANGRGIREQVLAQQDLPNPIALILPDGTTTRVWLATAKDGKKLIDDALWWGINCAGGTETPLEVVSSHEPAPRHPSGPDSYRTGPTPGALQGDDVVLEYYEDGYPKKLRVVESGE